MPDSTPSILVLSERLDRWFSHPDALAELLRAEGINDIETGWVEDLSLDMLDERSLVVLGPAEPSPPIQEMLMAFVTGGGGLICCAPGEHFAATMGLASRKLGVADGRVKINNDGFPDHGLPLKGWTQRYTGGKEEHTVLAPLIDANGRSTGDGAAIYMSKGAGKLIILAYDVSACVYLLRQGNPLLGGFRSSGFDRMRPSDLFQDWQVDQDSVWPVADLHCHYLRELIHQAWPDNSVLPWLWYFPDGVDTMMTFTSDDDWSTRPQFESLIDACETHEAGLTFYLVQERSVMDRVWFEDLAARGFDFSIHPDLPPPTLPLWEDRLRTHVSQFKDTYGRPPTPSVRNHCITWAGYLDGVRIQARHGFTFDTNWFSLLPQGKHYMTGSGLPMKFADLSGNVLPMFQLPTQFSDETTLGGQGFEWSLDLTPDQGVTCVTDIMKQNAAGTHSMLCVNAHPVSFATYSAALWEPVLAYAHSSGIPVWDVDRFSRFWHARRDVRLRPVPKGGKLELPESSPALNGLRAMVPSEGDNPGSGSRRICGRSFVEHSLS